MKDLDRTVFGLTDTSSPSLTFRSGGDGRDLTPLPPRRAGEVRFLGKNGTVVTVVPVSEEQHKMVRLPVFLLEASCGSFSSSPSD